MTADQEQRIIGYFLQEAKDHLETIEQGLLNLQSTIEDPEMLYELFRAAHSIKGGAAMLGFNSIQKTAHRLEDCFIVFQDTFQSVRVDQKLELLFLKVFDVLQALLDQLSESAGVVEEDANNQIMLDVEPVFEELQEHQVSLINEALTPKFELSKKHDLHLSDDAQVTDENLLAERQDWGGLEEIKLRLDHESEELKIAALQEAIKYGKEGLKLVIHALKNESWAIQCVAYELIAERADPKAKQALQKYNPFLSPAGIDYTILRDLLVARKWQEADAETARVMFLAAGKATDYGGEELQPEEIAQFPSSDLTIIDNLWLKYSYGHYALSVQKQIWQSVSANEDSFRERVGWYRWDSVNVNFRVDRYECPAGYLPQEPHRRLSGFGGGSHGKQGLGAILVPLLERPDL